MATVLSLVACTANEPQNQACKIALATDLPFSVVHHHIVTTALLNGQPVPLALDTGAALTTLDRDTVERLNLTVADTSLTANGIGGSRGVYGFFARTFKIGDLHGTNLYLATAGFKLTQDGSIEGLLGADNLSRYNVDLDLSEHKARLFAVISGCTSPSALLDQPLFRAPLVTPMAENHHSAWRGLGLDEPVMRSAGREDPRPFVNVEIGGKRFLAVIDSGAGQTTMFAKAARRLGLTQDKLAAETQHYFIGGIGPERVRTTGTVMSPMTVGEITISNLPIGIAEDQMGDGTDMLLGLDFLSRVHVFISFSSRTLIMQYPPKASPKISG